MSSSPGPASDSAQDRQPETPAALERQRHATADAAEAVADALRENDFAEFQRAFGDLQTCLSVLRSLPAVRDAFGQPAIPDPVDAPGEPTGYAATVERAERVLSDDPLGSNAIDGAAERAPDRHNMTEATDE